MPVFTSYLPPAITRDYRSSYMPDTLIRRIEPLDEKIGKANPLSDKETAEGINLLDMCRRLKPAREEINSLSARLKSCPDTRQLKSDFFGGPLESALDDKVKGS